MTRILLLLLILCGNVYADNLTGFDDDNLPILNETLRKLQRAQYGFASDAELAEKIDIPSSANAGDLLYYNGANSTWSSTAGSPTLGTMFYYNNTAVTAFSVGNEGDVLTTTSGIPAWSAPASSGNSEVFTSNGTITAASSVLFVTMVGGGGGGGGSSSDGGYGGGGGGGGAGCFRVACNVTLGATYNIVVGVGGNGGVDGSPPGINGNGTSGTNSSFGSFIICGGGTYGEEFGPPGTGGTVTAAVNTSLTAIGTIGGNPLGRYYNTNFNIFSGGNGAPNVGTNNGLGGGGSILGKGGNAAGVSSSPGNPGNIGGGGGGAGNTHPLGAGYGAAGGDGGDGIVIIEW